jgi:dipeptidyl aminopeptidase/acylaminoacyl peptidase
VSRDQADLIAGSLRARGVPVEYMLAAGQGHGPNGRAADIELTARMARFLEEHLE